MNSGCSFAAVARRRVHIFVCVHMKHTHTECSIVAAFKECVKKTYTEGSFVAILQKCVENTRVE